MVMEIKLQLIVTACIAIFGLEPARQQSQAVHKAATRSAHDESKIQDNLQNLFDSLAKNDGKGNDHYRAILRQEVEKRRQAFATMKQELEHARHKNTNKKILDHTVAMRNKREEYTMVEGWPSKGWPFIKPEELRDLTTPVMPNDTSSEEKKFLTPITPIITDVKNQTKAMEKLRTIWLDQQKFYEDAVKQIKALCAKSKESPEMIGFLFEEIDPLIERQTRVLTTLPWENTDEMYEVVDLELLRQQERSWDALGRCLTDQYDFPNLQAEEKKLRTSLIHAKEDLIQQTDQILRMVKVNMTMYKEVVFRDTW